MKNYRYFQLILKRVMLPLLSLKMFLNYFKTRQVKMLFLSRILQIQTFTDTEKIFFVIKSTMVLNIEVSPLQRSLKIRCTMFFSQSYKSLKYF